jgi:hypothetical protein
VVVVAEPPPVRSPEKRLDKSPICEEALARGGSGDMGDGSVAGAFVGRIPRAGTDTPAAPRRLTAPWLIMSTLPPVLDGVKAAVGLPVPLRGGSLGGSRGGAGLPATMESYDGGGGVVF